MAQFQNDELEYVVDDYFDIADFEDTDAFAGNQLRGSYGAYSDFDDDDFAESKVKTDTSAMEARNGKDIQGIPWERLNFTRDRYRETRLKQYKNYESLSLPRQDLEKECLPVEMGKTFYDFHYNTRIVKSTIVHFQLLQQGGS